MALGSCRKCGRTLTWEHPTCPHCGAADPVELPWTEARDPLSLRSRGGEGCRRGLGWLVLAFVVLSLLALCSSPPWEAAARVWTELNVRD